MAISHRCANCETSVKAVISAKYTAKLHLQQSSLWEHYIAVLLLSFLQLHLLQTRSWIWLEIFRENRALAFSPVPPSPRRKPQEGNWNLNLLTLLTPYAPQTKELVKTFVLRNIYHAVWGLLRIASTHKLRIRKPCEGSNSNLIFQMSRAIRNHYSRINRYIAFTISMTCLKSGFRWSFKCIISTNSVCEVELDPSMYHKALHISSSAYFSMAQENVLTAIIALFLEYYFGALIIIANLTFSVSRHCKRFG